MQIGKSLPGNNLAEEECDHQLLLDKPFFPNYSLSTWIWMMTATNTLPEQFALHREINLQKDQALLIKLNLWGLVSLPVIGYFLVQIG